MAKSMKMGHRWVLEAKKGLEWPFLAIIPLKLTFLEIKLAFETPKT